MPGSCSQLPTLLSAATQVVLQKAFRVPVQAVLALAQINQQGLTKLGFLVCQSRRPGLEMEQPLFLTRDKYIPGQSKQQLTLAAPRSPAFSQLAFLTSFRSKPEQTRLL